MQRTHVENVSTLNSTSYQSHDYLQGEAIATYVDQYVVDNAGSMSSTMG